MYTICITVIVLLVDDLLPLLIIGNCQLIFEKTSTKEFETLPYVIKTKGIVSMQRRIYHKIMYE